MEQLTLALIARELDLTLNGELTADRAAVLDAIRELRCQRDDYRAQSDNYSYRLDRAERSRRDLDNELDQTRRDADYWRRDLEEKIDRLERQLREAEYERDQARSDLHAYSSGYRW